MITFLTYFDGNFLVRGLAMMEALMAHMSLPWRIEVLALDAAAADGVAAWRRESGAEVRVRHLAELEARFPELQAMARNRSRIELYFSLTSFLSAFVLEQLAPGERALYLDADLGFFADPALLLAESADAPIAIVEHRFPPRLRHLAAVYGRFNVAWLGMMHSPAAEACIARWRAQCREWCFDRPEPGRYADQFYLDEWPSLVPGLHVIAHPGADVAPWNLAGHDIRAGGDGVTIDGQPLVFFHFHRLKRLAAGIYEADYHGYDTMDPAVRDHVYPPYLARLDRLERRYAAAPEGSGRLHRLERRFEWRPRRWLSRAYGRARLLTGERVIFSGARALPRLGALLFPRGGA